MAAIESLPEKPATILTLRGPWCALAGLQKAFEANIAFNKVHQTWNGEDRFNDLVALAGSFIGRDGCAQFDSRIHTDDTLA